MHQLSFGFSTERTLPFREINSFDLPNPIHLVARVKQLKLKFPSPNVKRRGGVRKKTMLFKDMATVNCCFCDKSLSFKDATIEHIIPRSKGGTNSLSNLSLSCAPCNHRRHDIDFDLWKKSFSKKKDLLSQLISHLKKSNRFIERKYLK
jgi:5-methylcytosine-specific restriction endonuclease McrA